MKRRLKLTQAAKFTLFSTGFMLFMLLAVYGIIVLDMVSNESSPVEAARDVVHAWHFAFILTSSVVAFAVSSMIIDSIFNPLRQMSIKMAEVSNMKFDSPLIVDAGDNELRDIAYAFNTMTAKLNKYISMQKRFVQDASHELATPITIINGHADLVIRRGEENPQMVRQSLIVIKNEIERMSGLVDGLLMLAKNDSGSYSYNFDDVDMAKLITGTAEEAKMIYPDFVFEVGAIVPMLPVRCDFYAIQRVLRILISNAVKYAGGNKNKIVLSLEKNHGIVTVSVKDFGIGIPAEHIGRIFERFYRVDESRAKKTGSSGLGLAIAHEIIASHGGEIFAESEAGEWTKVSFRLSG